MNIKTPSQIVKEGRHALGVTQRELAELYGNRIRQDYVSRWESGKMAVPADFLVWLIVKSGIEI